jgi:hypothetical protein
MGISFHHSGGNLPITLGLDEDEATHRCPLCERADYEGTVTVRAPTEQQEGMTPVTCTRGHMVMVTWSRPKAN